MMAVNERTLLLVDDEENVLRALKRLCRRDGYRILTAGGGKEGLELLQENRVGVIVSDQRMPEMSGVEFLSKVKELYPETVRIMLSGYTELGSVTDAINRGAIYKFLTKPWDGNLLRENIAEAFKSYELVRENERLATELRDSNESLTQANEDLEKYAKLNFKLLQVSQEVLEILPVGVIGMGDDNIIAIANKKAHELLSPRGGGLIGMLGDEVLPPQLNEFCRMEMDEEKVRNWEGELDGVGEIKVILSRMGQSSMSKGSVLAFIAREEGL